MMQLDTNYKGTVRPWHGDEQNESVHASAGFYQKSIVSASCTKTVYNKCSTTMVISPLKLHAGKNCRSCKLSKTVVPLHLFTVAEPHF